MDFPTHEQALRALLKKVDYTSDPPACLGVETVGAVIPKEVLDLCREALSHPVGAEGRALGVMSRGLMAILITAEAKGVPNLATLRTAIKSIMHDALIAARSGAAPDEPAVTLNRSGFR